MPSQNKMKSGETLMRDFGECTQFNFLEPQKGTVEAFAANGVTLVRIGEELVQVAESLCPLDGSLVGARVLVGRLGVGELVILGRLYAPAAVVTSDGGKDQVIDAERSLELRCGKARIKLHADGRITLRGTQILSRSNGANRVQGASVQLN